MSTLLLQGSDPYERNQEGFTAIQKGLYFSGHRPGLRSLLLNWDLDLDRVPEVTSSWEKPDHTTLKLLLRRIPKVSLARDLDVKTRYLLKGSPLSRASAHRNIRVMKILIEAGASLESDIQDQGTPLITACSMRRLEAVKCLVRTGANVIGSKDGKSCSAREAAKDFPAIVQWLLVDQHKDQVKILASPFNEVGQDSREWFGVRPAEVIITGLYAPLWSENMIERVFDLVWIRKGFHGKVVAVHRWVDWGTVRMATVGHKLLIA